MIKCMNCGEEVRQAVFVEEKPGRVKGLSGPLVCTGCFKSLFGYRPHARDMVEVRGAHEIPRPLLEMQQRPLLGTTGKLHEPPRRLLAARGDKEVEDLHSAVLGHLGSSTDGAGAPLCPRCKRDLKPEYLVFELSCKDCEFRVTTQSWSDEPDIWKLGRRMYADWEKGKGCPNPECPAGQGSGKISGKLVTTLAIQCPCGMVFRPAGGTFVEDIRTKWAKFKAWLQEHK